MNRKLLGCCVIMMVFFGCSTAAKKPAEDATFAAKKLDALVNGDPVIELDAPLTDLTQPQIISVQILPSRGMNIFQIQGFLPGRGNVNLFFAQSLHAGENSLGDEAKDTNGNLSFSEGGALLAPYSNRIRGKLSADGKTLTTKILNKWVTLPANWSGKKPEAIKNTMHGLILNSKIQDLQLEHTSERAVATGTLHAGDFGGHWLSKTDLQFVVTLQTNQVDIEVTAKNVGKVKEPIGFGWHPYFAFPSGDRKQARLHIPAQSRLLVDNYDDVFPTGKKESVTGTPYDFKSADGKALGDLYMDDCFVDLLKSEDSQAVAEITDPAAHYGMRITAVSPEISAFQAYAPIDKAFVAFEPQFNLADPYNHHIWKKGEKTGMVILKPGDSTTYHVKLNLFAPTSNPAASSSN